MLIFTTAEFMHSASKWGEAFLIVCVFLLNAESQITHRQRTQSLFKEHLVDLQNTLVKKVSVNEAHLSHPIANSSMLVFPMRMAPWSSSFWTTVALKGGI